MRYVIFFTTIFLGLFQGLLDWRFREKMPNGTMSETNGFKLYSWTLGIISVVSVVVLLFLDLGTVNPFIGLILILLFVVRGIFEWNYIKDTKRHVVSFILAATSLVITLIYFVLWKDYYR